MSKDNKPVCDDEDAIDNSKPVFDIVANKLIPKDKIIMVSSPVYNKSLIDRQIMAMSAKGKQNIQILEYKDHRNNEVVEITNLGDEPVFISPSGYQYKPKLMAFKDFPKSDSDDPKDKITLEIMKSREELFMNIYRWPSKCPVINDFILKERNEYNFAVNYVKEYAEMNNVSIDVAAARIVNMPNLDNSIKKHIVKLFEDKAF